jgi:hypothetical protein
MGKKQPFVRAIKVNLVIGQESKADDQLEIPAVAVVSFQ